MFKVGDILIAMDDMQMLPVHLRRLEVVSLRCDGYKLKDTNGHFFDYGSSIHTMYTLEAGCRQRLNTKKALGL